MWTKQPASAYSIFSHWMFLKHPPSTIELGGLWRACNHQSLIYCQAARQCCSRLEVPTKFSLLSYFYSSHVYSKGNVKPGSCSSIVAESWVSDSYSSPWSSSCFWRTFSLVARCQEMQTPPWLSPIFSTTAFIWSNNQGANVIMTSKLCHGLGQIRVPLFPPDAKENSHQNQFRFTTPPCNFYCQFILSVSGKILEYWSFQVSLACREKTEWMHAIHMHVTFCSYIELIWTVHSIQLQCEKQWSRCLIVKV